MEELNTKLYLAARDGNTDEVVSCLQRGADINYKDSLGWTALHLAALYGHDRIVEILVEGGGDVNVQNRGGRTALHWAAYEGHDRSVEILVEGGGEVNVQTNSGMTALHHAAGGGRDRSVEILVEGGGDINVQDEEGRTALHLAAVRGHDRIVGILVEGGGDINVQDNTGSTPLHHALKKESWHDTDYIKRKERTAVLLVQLGADMTLKDNEGKTPLDYCSEDLKSSLEVLPSQILEIKAAFPTIACTKEFRVLLTKGTYKSYNNRVYLGGACNVGKSTLASNLIGENILLTWNSTDGLVIYFGRNGIDLEKKEMVPLKKGPQDNSILTSVLRGQPTMEHLSTTAEGGTDEKSQRTPNVSSPPPTTHMTRPSVRKKERSYRTSKNTQGPPLVYKKENTNVHQSIMEEIRKGEYKVSIAPSDLVDFGGQRAFDLTHQLFIQQKGAFVLLLDGRKDLDEILSEYTDGKMTTREILLHWVNSILTYCSPADDDIYPVIVFAATHRDELTEEEAKLKIEALPGQLAKMFSTHDHSKRIQCDKVFFINARDSNDPGVLALKKYLVDVAFQQKSWGEMMPMAWVPLELQIAELRSTNTFVISFEELNDLNTTNADLFLTENQLKDFLRCQHSLGRLMYFDIHQLDQFIVVQPTAMVDILRSFVTDKIFWPEEPTLKPVLQNASETGIIKKMDLFKLWNQENFKEYFPTSEIKEFVTRVLVHLDILVEPKRFHKSLENLTDAFVVPCLINQSLPDEYLPLNLNEENTILLSYRLLKSTIPNALAYKLIGAVLNIWPLKRTDERCWLFDKAAVLEIDQNNDLYLSFRDNRFIVALFNTRSKNHLSPDTSSIIEECLTSTMEKVLDFYFTSFGKSSSKVDVSTLFETEVGEKCVDGICFTALSNIKDKPSWACENNIEHRTRFLSYWKFHQEKEMCGENCPGLFMDCLDEVPEDKYLIRLAKRVGKRFDDFIINLELTMDEWEDIESNRTYPDPLTKRFIALGECKNQGKTFSDFSTALIASGYSTHFLCQVFMGKWKDVSDIANVKFQETPDDEVLNDLSKKIGNYAMPLGVELGLELPIIESIIYENNKNMFGQNLGVLCEWQKRGKNTTIIFLMKALHQADKRGFNFLLEKYK